MVEGGGRGAALLFVAVPRMLRSAVAVRRGSGAQRVLSRYASRLCGAAFHAAPRPGHASPLLPLSHTSGKRKQNVGPPATSALRGLACKCPRCGKGKLYTGFLTLRPRCESCGLDYAFIDTGDGPAIFIIMLAGAIVVGWALL